MAKNSAAIIASIGLSDPVHPDFGSGLYNGEPIGIPYRGRRRATPQGAGHVPVRLGVRQGPVPDAAKACRSRAGTRSTGDRHVIVVDRDTCTDYELFAAYPHDGGTRWTAGSGAIFNLRSNHLRPAGWTSADAAGLPILPGLARYDEVAAGAIDHALRFTAPCTAPRYVYPARHEASTCHGAEPAADGTARPPEGRASTSPGCPTRRASSPRRSSATGMILADNGSPWFISGAPDPGWNNDALHLLDRLHRHATSRSSTRARCRTPGCRRTAGGRREGGIRAAPGDESDAARQALSAAWVRVRLTDRDLELLAFLAEHRLVLADQSRRCWTSPPRRRAAAAASSRAAGYLERQHAFAGEPSCYQITRKGLAVIGSRSARAPSRPAPATTHDVGLAWLWLAARAGTFGPLREILAERQLRSRDGSRRAPGAEPLGGQARRLRSARPRAAALPGPAAARPPTAGGSRSSSS